MPTLTPAPPSAPAVSMEPMAYSYTLSIPAARVADGLRLARADYPDLHSVPPTPAALENAKLRGPDATRELQNDRDISTVQKYQLDEHVETDGPNSLIGDPLQQDKTSAVPPILP